MRQPISFDHKQSVWNKCGRARTSPWGGWVTQRISRPSEVREKLGRERQSGRIWGREGRSKWFVLNAAVQKCSSDATKGNKSPRAFCHHNLWQLKTHGKNIYQISNFRPFLRLKRGVLCPQKEGSVKSPGKSEIFQTKFEFDGWRSGGWRSRHQNTRKKDAVLWLPKDRWINFTKKLSLKHVWNSFMSKHVGFLWQVSKFNKCQLSNKLEEKFRWKTPKLSNSNFTWNPLAFAFLNVQF